MEIEIYFLGATSSSSSGDYNFDTEIFYKSCYDYSASPEHLHINTIYNKYYPDHYFNCVFGGGGVVNITSWDNQELSELITNFYQV